MIYFDNASTTKTDIDVLKKLEEAYREYWANPSSLHTLGFKVEKKINEARELIAKELKTTDKNIYFAPSGTIANNAVLNSFDVNGKNIIISEIEHKSILNKSKNLNAEIRYVKVDRYGFVDKEDLLSKIDENTSLVSIIHVNNELGTINDINELAKIVKEKNKNIAFHSDGIQAFKKIKVSLDKIDFYTISSHKINGPKGISALYVRQRHMVKSLYFGGGQEKGLFAGTENVPSIVGFGKAATLNNNFKKILNINNYLRKEIRAISDCIILSPVENSSPYILNVCFKTVGAEILLHYLEMEDIYVSTGSACNKDERSAIFNAIPVNDEYNNGCVRISLCRDSTMEEAKKFVLKLKEKVEIIRGIIR